MSRKPRQSPAEKLVQLRAKNAELTGHEAFVAARETALRRLDIRAYSEQELRDIIRSRGFSEETTDQVIVRLVDLGFINDIQYAEAVVRSRFYGSGKVGRALRDDLQRKGISADVIEQAVSAVGEDELLERAQKLVASKRRSLQGCDRAVIYRRLGATLARKGYSPSIASRVITQALEEWGSEDDNEFDNY